jgi:predicted AAA+ superfamily ATPase
VAASDYPMPLDLLVGVERQKDRFVENLTRFAVGLPCNHVLLWGVRGTGKSSMTKAAFMSVAASMPP